jgi:hypothetical protein
MAKKKTTKAATPAKPTKTTKSTTPKKKSTATHAPRKQTSEPVDTALERVLETENASTVEEGPTPARENGALTGIEIGHVAGEVWGVLSGKGPLTVAAIKKEVQAPGDTVVAAIGWLAREEKLDFITAGRTVKIALR